jgi:UDP-sulfoquinovose synthase
LSASIESSSPPSIGDDSVTQRILILGGDGYLGWPTAMALSKAGHRVALVDNFAKRQWELEIGVRPLFPIPTLHERVRTWRECTGLEIELSVGDLTDYAFVDSVIRDLRPDTIIHYGEQPSAPYSMIDVRHATYTQTNNVVGNLNVLFAIRDASPETHLVKLGTMGEYGTPDIDIEEGYLTVDHNGRKHTFLYPKTPGSMYHLSKVHDSHNIHFACRIWGLRATDLNQGVVYGVETDESAIDPRLATSFHYDEVFGTALNRFCVQAAIGHPLTVYGQGGQTRGYLNIRDTVACVALATATPAEPGQLRVFNQFTEQFSVLELAERVKLAGEHLGWTVSIEHAPNPRIEMEQHYYKAVHTGLLSLGLQPRLLSEELIDTMLGRIKEHEDRIDPATLVQNVRWAPERTLEPSHV